ncbi:MAG TPA: hypothetical protein VEJ38_09125 [Candidatus Acidoferrales bacterium]|nr:hypothetical protein [Candidatus Acidoferrales bacterium]
MSRVEKAIWTAMMLVLVLLEITSIYKEQREHDAEQAEARALQLQGFQNIANGVNTTINESQQQFAATMSNIQKAMNIETGGNSYCYIDLGNVGDAGGIITAVQQGEFPLHDTDVRIVDVDKWNKLPQPLNMEEIGSAETDLKIGELSPTSAKMLGNYRFTSGESHSFNIFFSATNGFWTEFLRVRRVDGKWLQAIKVFRPENLGNGRTKNIQLLVKVDPKFPRTKGKVDWGQ